MSQPSFQSIRQWILTLFSSKYVFHKARAATVFAVSAKHASTTSEPVKHDSPLLKTEDLRSTRSKWDWLPLHTQYQAARQTIVLCHGIIPSAEF